jgi:uncharacterized protein (TIGR02301 family)
MTRQMKRGFCCPKIGLFLLCLPLIAGVIMPVAQAQAARPLSPPATPLSPQATPSTPAPPEPQPPVYDNDLLRLAEIIGTLAFLRALCGHPDAQEWPQRMQALLDAEGTGPLQRGKLVGMFNHGYRNFALTYRTCTPSAEMATKLYARKGEKLSHNLSRRYGG